MISLQFYINKISITKHHLQSTLKKNTMGNLLYVVAVILVIAWAIGFIGYSAGGLIHILLVIAIIAIILRIIQGQKVL
jgi:hypothetical protein